jgi:hypothetical protein
MKILIVCSNRFYDRISDIQKELEAKGHEIYLPNYYGDSTIAGKIKKMNEKEFKKFKGEMFDRSDREISKVDAILALNYDKVSSEITLKNYIGGATFLEMFVAYRKNKIIYLLNPIPSCILTDEIRAFDVKVINGDLNKIILCYQL